MEYCVADRNSSCQQDIHGSCLFVTAEPLPLMDICRRNIRRQMGKDKLEHVTDLPIPTSLKGYLLYR